MALSDFGPFITEHYQAEEWRHASAVLKKEFPVEWDDLVHILTSFRLHQTYIEKAGGNKSLVAKAIDGLFQERGWRKERRFKIEILVDGKPHLSPTHGVDNFKNRVAQETEWNNKDPFFDRDLNNFRLLHELGIVSVGIVITRADELQEIFDSMGRGSSYGQATTHMSKLRPKIEGGGAGGCPVLAFGITQKLYVPST